MNSYQQKWLDLLTNANIKDWTIEGSGDDINITMPNVTDLKLIKDNLPQTLAAIALDIDIPKERVKFHVHNGYEDFEYVLNPSPNDLNEA